MVPYKMKPSLLEVVVIPEWEARPHHLPGYLQPELPAHITSTLSTQDTVVLESADITVTHTTGITVTGGTGVTAVTSGVDNGPWIRIHKEAYEQWTVDTDTQ